MVAPNIPTPRTAQAHFKLTPDEKALLVRAAALEGRTLAQYVRYHALEAARETWGAPPAEWPPIDRETKHAR